MSGPTRVRAALAALLAAFAVALASAEPANAQDPTPSPAAHSVAAASSATVDTSPAAQARILANKPKAVTANPPAKGINRTPKSAVRPSAVTPNTAWSLSVTSSPVHLWDYQRPTVTVTANQTVSGTGYGIIVFDNYTWSVLAVCTSGTTCSAQVSMPSATNETDGVWGLIAPPQTGSGFPGNVQAEVDYGITWHRVHLTSFAASATTAQTGASVTISVTTNANVGPTPFYIDLFDATTGTFVGDCYTDSTCVKTVSQSTAGTHRYAVYVSSDVPTGAYPPSNVESSSRNVFVSWSATAYQVSLSAPKYVYGGGPVSLSAATNAPAGSGNVLEIFNETYGVLVATCTIGTTCDIAYSESHSGNNSYVAFVAPPSTALPPSGTVASSVDVITSNYLMYTSGVSAQNSAAAKATPTATKATNTPTASAATAAGGHKQQPTPPVPTATPGYGSGRADSAGGVKGSAAAAVPFTVSISATSTSLAASQYSTLTATANQPVDGTGYVIAIYDTSDETLVGSCNTGSTCSISTVRYDGVTDYFDAVVGLPASSSSAWPDTSVAETDPRNSIYVQWVQVYVAAFSASPTTTAVRGSATITATMSTDILYTEYYAELFDDTTGSFIGEYAGGTTLTWPVSQDAAGTHRYTVYLTPDLSGTFPVPNPEFKWTTVRPYVTWSDAGFQVSVTAPSTVYDSNPIPVTATTNIDVSKAGYAIEIFNGSTGALVGYCTTGTSCTVNDQENHLGLNEFVAFVATTVSTTLPPATTVASSNVTASWRSYIP